MIKTNNLVLKISSLAVAFLVWIIVVNVSNPIVTRNISVPLNVVNANIITDAGKTYSLMGANSVTVSYEVRSRDQSRIAASDFNASIDLGDMYDITGAVPIAVEVVNNKDLIIGAVASKPSIVRVSIEDLQRKEFTLTTKITGTPSDGFSVGEVKLDKTNVVVTGPVSVIGQISQIGVEIDVTGLDSDESGRAELKYFDANGNAFVISDSRVSKSFDNVGYSLVMLNGRTLALNFDVGGTAAQGYKFMPANVTAVGDTKVNVTLKVEALDKKSLTLTVNDLNIVGSKPGVATNIVPEKITVVVSGLSANLESVTNADLKATLDVSEMNSGSNVGSLKFEPATGLSVDSYTPFEVIIGNHTSEKNEKNETTTAAEQSSTETASSAEN